MKYGALLFLVVYILHPFQAMAAGNHRVNGYTKKNGTHVSSHRATNRSSTQRDNWSSKPNSNPYTGRRGVKEARK